MRRLALLATLTMCLISLPARVPGQGRPPAGGRPMRELSAEVERLRGLKFQRAVPEERVSRARMGEIVRAH